MERAWNEDLDDSWSQSFNADWKSPGDTYVLACNLDTVNRSTLGFPILSSGMLLNIQSLKHWTPVVIVFLIYAHQILSSLMVNHFPLQCSNNLSTTKVTISPTKQSQSSQLKGARVTGCYSFIARDTPTSTAR